MAAALDRATEIGIIAAAAIIAGLMVAMIVFEIRHPCLRHSSTPQTCTGYNSIQTGDTTVMVPYEYDCTPCIERAK